MVLKSLGIKKTIIFNTLAKYVRKLTDNEYESIGKPKEWAFFC